MHWSWLASDEHSLEQLPSQSPSQLPSQLKLPGLPVQLVVQLPWQLVVQSAVTLTLHVPLQLASSVAEHWSWKLTGVQSAVQPPDVSNVQFASADRSMLPH
jgi:hypothetical protein